MGCSQEWPFTLRFAGEIARRGSNFWLLTNRHSHCTLCLTSPLKCGPARKFLENEREFPEVKKLRQFLHDEQGQDIAEYAVMLAVILVLVVGTIRLVGTNANNAFSTVASSLQ